METQYSVLTSSHGLDQVDVPRRYNSFMDRGRPAVPEEVGYGGGTWTYHEISEEEKTRLEREQFSYTDDAEVLPRYPEH